MRIRILLFFATNNTELVHTRKILTVKKFLNVVIKVQGKSKRHNPILILQKQ